MSIRNVFLLVIACTLAASGTCAGTQPEELHQWDSSGGGDFAVRTTASTTKLIKDPLANEVQMSFGSNVTTVGEAIEILLMSTGYKLPNEFAADPFMSIMLERPLPRSYRKLGPMPIYVALDTLAGDEFATVTDDLHRLVGFDLISEYRRHYAKNKPYSYIPRDRSHLTSQVREWRIRKGELFSEGIKRWGTDVKWRLRITGQDDLIMEDDYIVKGSFFGAVAEALGHYELHGTDVRHRFMENVDVLMIKFGK